MNPNHLLTFAIVARFRSITQAARYLNLGQPAVSGQLKLLQSTVGEPLYDRKGHQIVLTPAGEGLLEFAGRMEQVFKQADEYIRSLQKVNAGTLRLGSTSTIASYYLPRFVVQLQTEHPGVQVYMTTGNTQEILGNLQVLDLGFIEGPVEEADLPGNYQVIPWQDDEIVMVLPEDHELTREFPESVPLSVFSAHQVIWREPGSGARDVVEKALYEAGIDAPVNIEVNGVAGIKEAVRAGMGIGFVSSHALRHENKSLVARRINPPHGLTWHLNIIAPRTSIQSRTSAAFLDLCTHNTKRN